ncbi:hypothetical protein EDB19DRAFT_1827259 [Suillus lakei]|nr:hypothetical protein EDB19DRAFT_1827259 [Suillus lakei]
MYTWPIVAQEAHNKKLNKWKAGASFEEMEGGQLEISMMREFLCRMHMEALAHMVVNKSQIAVKKTIFEQILGEGDKAVGMVQDIAMEREIINDDMLHSIQLMDPSNLLAELQSLLRVQCGPPASTMQEKLSDPACLTLLRAYNATHPQVHFILDHDPPPQTVPLHDYAVFYHYGLLDGCRITPASQSKRTSAGSSLVKVDFDGQLWYGEIVNILRHPQHGVPGMVTETLLAEFCWMKEVPLSPVNDDPWSDFPELDIVCFTINEYWQPNDQGCPPIILPFDQIICQIARGVVESTNPHMWITTSLDCVRDFLVL